MPSVFYGLFFLKKNSTFVSLSDYHRPVYFPIYQIPKTILQGTGHDMSMRLVV